MGAGGGWVGAEAEVTVGAGNVSVGRGVTVACCAMGSGDGVAPQAAYRAASRSSRSAVRKVLIGVSPQIGHIAA